METNNLIHLSAESCVSQTKNLSFYEENYLLEPDSYDDEAESYEENRDYPGYFDEEELGESYELL